MIPGPPFSGKLPASVLARRLDQYCPESDARCRRISCPSARRRRVADRRSGNYIVGLSTRSCLRRVVVLAENRKSRDAAGGRPTNGSTEHPGVLLKERPRTASTIKRHCFWVEEVVVFVPSLCWVVVLLLDCPVWGFDVAALSVVLDGSTVVVRLSFCPVGCSVVVVFEFVWANAGPRTTMHPKAASAASREIDAILPPVSTPQSHSIRMATTRRASGITKEGLNRQVARGTVDFANGRLSS